MIQKVKKIDTAPKVVSEKRCKVCSCRESLGHYFECKLNKPKKRWWDLSA